MLFLEKAQLVPKQSERESTHCGVSTCVGLSHQRIAFFFCTQVCSEWSKLHTCVVYCYVQRNLLTSKGSMPFLEYHIAQHKGYFVASKAPLSIISRDTNRVMSTLNRSWVRRKVALPMPPVALYRLSRHHHLSSVLGS